MRSSFIITILMAALHTAWAQKSSDLLCEWVETDYSEYKITHEYFTQSGIAPSASGGYDMTGYIPVKEGDVIVFSGDRSPGIPFMMGYTDNEGHGATVLLGNFDANNWDELQVTEKEVTIPAGTAYVRCSARNTSLPQWARFNMSVIKRSLTEEQHVVHTWQDILSEHGYNPATVTDLTDSAKIKLPEPSCAYVNITGTGRMPTKKTEKLQAWLECYDGNGSYFKKRVMMSAQGNFSMGFVKKNVSVKFYEESWGEGKTTDITFGNRVKQDAFHLKAYYTDYFRGCGKIAYDIYDDITSDREKPLPWQRAGITTASKKAMCHPNGFPCYVYLNGNFYGLFVWSLKKDRKNMGQEKDNASHIHLDGTLAGENIFHGKINWSKFEVRNPKGLYCVETTEAEGVAGYRQYDGDNPTELIDSTMPYYDPDNPGHVLTNRVKQSIVRLSRYYAELKGLESAKTDSGTFKSQFSQYFDTQGMTDYYVHSIVTNNYDGHGKNWQWFTYDGIKWYVEPYDLDCTFGHHASGDVIMPPEWNCSTGERYYQFQGASGIQSLFRKYFSDAIKERYVTLRGKQLIDAERYSDYFRAWVDRIGQEGFNMEYAKWKESPCILETIVNPNWETEDDWENFNQYPVFSTDVTYQAGDRCTDRHRIWTATATTKGVRPYKQVGQVDSIGRVDEWIRERISLLDGYFSFDPNGIKELPSDKQTRTNARKVIRAGHLYIIKDGKVYSADGKLHNAVHLRRALP